MYVDLDRIDRNWANCSHITDAEILQTLCQKELERALQESFLERLELVTCDRSLRQIAGASKILNSGKTRH